MTAPHVRCIALTAADGTPLRLRCRDLYHVPAIAPGETLVRLHNGRYARVRESLATVLSRGHARWLLAPNAFEPWCG